MSKKFSLLGMGISLGMSILSFVQRDWTEGCAWLCCLMAEIRVFKVEKQEI